MATVFYCRRFPAGEAAIRTRLGIVRFQDGRAVVTDDAVAAALREVPPVFQIEEENPPGNTGRRGRGRRKTTPRET